MEIVEKELRQNTTAVVGGLAFGAVYRGTLLVDTSKRSVEHTKGVTGTFLRITSASGSVKGMVDLSNGRYYSAYWYPTILIPHAITAKLYVQKDAA